MFQISQLNTIYTCKCQGLEVICRFLRSHYTYRHKFALSRSKKTSCSCINEVVGLESAIRTEAKRATSFSLLLHLCTLCKGFSDWLKAMNVVSPLMLVSYLLLKSVLFAYCDNFNMLLIYKM